MNLPIYQLIIPEDESAGIQYVALVDEPATEKYFLTFNKQSEYFRFQIVNAEQRILSGPLMVAGLPIYRYDKMRGGHYVVFTSEAIKNLALLFFQQGFGHRLNLMHEADARPEGIYLFESFLIDRSRGIHPPALPAFKDLPEGSWFVSYKVDNDAVWNDFIKTGILKGFSVEGFFQYPVEPMSNEEKLLKAVEGIFEEDI